MDSRSACVGDNSVPAKALIFDIMRYCVHDGPGLRTTVFFKGCPLSCLWCHNPESQSRQPQVMYLAEHCIRCGDCLPACPEKALRWQDGPLRDTNLCRGCGKCVDACPSTAREMAGRWMTVADVLGAVSRDQVFYDESGGGVTFSGGEPLSQAPFLEAILDACRQAGIRTAVDTSGFASSKTIARISGKVDLFLYDLKVLDPVKHVEVTGVKNDIILQNLAFLARQRVPVIVRIPVVPTVNDGDANVDASIRFLAELELFQVDLLPYHRIGAEKYARLQMQERWHEFPETCPEHVESMAGRFRNAGFTVRIGG